MKLPPSLTKSAPDLLPEMIPLHTLTPRLQRMVAILLAHEAVICQYNIGSVELHFHQESVEAKLGCNLSRGVAPKKSLTTL
jgi:hypothetical protein